MFETTRTRKPIPKQKERTYTMAACGSAATISPLIPDTALTREDAEFLARFGFEATKTEQDGIPCTYFHAADYQNSTSDDGPELDEEALAARLCEILKRSAGSVPFLYVHMAHTSSKMEPDSQGGAAIFATAEDYRFHSTWNWIGDQIESAKKKGK